MAQGIFGLLYPNEQSISAGVNPETKTSRFSVEVMHEVGVDLSTHVPRNCQVYVSKSFHHIICFSKVAQTFCLNNFPIEKVYFMDVADPFNATGTHDEVLNIYRRTRDEITQHIKDFFEKYQ